MQPVSFAGLVSRNDREIRSAVEAIFYGFEGRIRSAKYDQQIFLGDGAVGRVNQVPPATYGLLYFGFSLLTNYKSVYQPIDLALDGLIRNRDFLGHGLRPFFGKEISNLPAKPVGLH
jgi:hypothetical protein